MFICFTLISFPNIHFNFKVQICWFLKGCWMVYLLRGGTWKPIGIYIYVYVNVYIYICVYLLYIYIIYIIYSFLCIHISWNWIHIYICIQIYSKYYDVYIYIYTCLIFDCLLYHGSPLCRYRCSQDMKDKHSKVALFGSKARFQRLLKRWMWDGCGKKTVWFVVDISGSVFVEIETIPSKTSIITNKRTLILQFILFLCFCWVLISSLQNRERDHGVILERVLACSSTVVCHWNRLLIRLRCRFYDVLHKVNGCVVLFVSENVITHECMNVWFVWCIGIL